MDEHTDRDGERERAVELLQELGLKEYEAKSFVALSRLPRGTAKEISEISEVPRTRVYDAVRVLETKGLVEIQHSNPKQFRAVPVDEAVETLKEEYDSRTESLRETLRRMESAATDDTEVTHEVWTLSGGQAIANRTRQLVDETQEEVVFVIGHESAFDEMAIRSLQSAQRRGVTVIVGTIAEGLRERVTEAVPEANVFVSGLEWLAASDAIGDTTQISRLLLIDRSTILVSTHSTASDDEEDGEKAVFGRGFNNGLVTITRRLMATGFLPERDPILDGDSGSDATE